MTFVGADHHCSVSEPFSTTNCQVGWKTGSRGVGVGNGEQGVGSEY